MIIDLISSGNWLPYFKPLARAFMDNDPAILLSELANQFNYYKAGDKLDGEGYFFCDAERIEHETCLSRYKQAKAIDKLENAGLIETKLKGLPATKHFKFPSDFEARFSNFVKQDSKNLEIKFPKNFKTGVKETSKPVVKKFEPNDNIPLKTKKEKIKNEKGTQVETCDPVVNPKEDIKGMPIKKSIKPKSAGGKWNGSFQPAKDIFDKCRKEWGVRQNMGDVEPIYWTAQECGQLSRLLTALKTKSEEQNQSRPPSQQRNYSTDIEFINEVLPLFLGTAAKLDKFYMDRFTPTSIFSNFNSVLVDVKNFIRNGNTNQSNRPKNNNGRNGHQLDPARTAYMESLLDP